MMKKKVLAMMIILFLAVGVFAGCSQGVTEASEPVAEEAATEEPAPIEPEAQGEPEMAKKAILVVSFGTSYPETRKVTIEACENEIADAYPEYEVRRAFTAQFIINKLAKRDNIMIDNPTQALDRLSQEGFSEVVVQPLHIITGTEYNEMVEVVAEYNDGRFDSLTMGRPILTGIEDYEMAAEALSEQLPVLEEKQAVVLMGHGTEHPANASYACLQSVLDKNGMNNVYMGTVEGYPTLDDVMVSLDEDGIEEVTLMPFMVVAGDHANNDMAGDEDDSWKTILEKEGYTVNAYLHGLGENPAFQGIYKQHVQDAMDGKGQEIPKPLVQVVADASKWVAGKKVVMVVSFGTSYADTRKMSIEATENAIGEAYPDYQVVRAFTSQFIINKLAKRDNIIVPNPQEAFEQMIADGVEEIVVQPLHIMAGSEYNELMGIAKQYERGFKSVTFGAPLLSSSEDYETAAFALQSQLPEIGEGEAVVLMGHGSEHPANASYACFQSVLNQEGMNQVYVGTVEGYPTYEDVLVKLKADGISKVTLMPFMVVAGDHANNDMAGDEEDSWKTMLKKEGFTVEIYMHGIGESTEFQQIYVDHVAAAMSSEEE